MVRRMFLTSICALLLVSAFSASPVYGFATSDSVATIDWEHFEITLDPGMSINWLEKDSISEAVADSDTSSDYDFEEQSDWVNTDATANVTETSGQAGGVAYTNNLLLYESTSASSDEGWYGAYAYAERYGSFEVSGSAGNITIKVPYTLSLDLSTDHFYEYAAGGASAYLDLYNINTDELFCSEDYIEYFITGMDSFSDDNSGYLSVNLYFNVGDKGDFFADVENYSYVEPIPEPATLLLLGSGCAGLAGMMRRRKQQH